MNFQYGRQEVLSSLKQATLPALVLSSGHRAAEDEMGGDLIHRLRPHQGLNTEWL